MTTNKFPCRCRNCKGRRSLKKHPLDYVKGRTPPCLTCHITEKQQRAKYGDKLPSHLMGANLIWRFDSYRYTKELELRKPSLCKADCMVPIYGRAFPHSMNSIGCICHIDRLLNRVIHDKAYNKVDPNEPCPF